MCQERGSTGHIRRRQQRFCFLPRCRLLLDSARHGTTQSVRSVRACFDNFGICVPLSSSRVRASLASLGNAFQMRNPGSNPPAGASAAHLGIQLCCPPTRSKPLEYQPLLLLLLLLLQQQQKWRRQPSQQTPAATTTPRKRLPRQLEELCGISLALQRRRGLLELRREVEQDLPIPGRTGRGRGRASLSVVQTAGTDGETNTSPVARSKRRAGRSTTQL